MVHPYRPLGLLLLLVLAACNGRETKPVTEASPPPPTVQARAFTNTTCPVSKAALRAAPELGPAVGAALSALALPLIEKGFDALGAALRNAAEPSTTKASMQTTAEFYLVRPNARVASIAPAWGCIIAVVGPFGEPGSGTFESAYWTSEDRAPARTLLNSFGLVGDPHLYLEAQVIASSDRSAFRLAVRHFEYAAALNPSTFNAKRDLVLSFIFEKPAADPDADDAKAFAIGSVSFKDLVAGKTLLTTAAMPGERFGTSWMPLPTVSPAATQILAGYTTALDSHTAALETRQALANERSALHSPETPTERKLQRLAEELEDLTSKEPPRVRSKARELEKERKEATRQARIRAIDRELGKAPPAAVEFPAALRAFEPFSVSVEIAETRNASEFLRFVASVFEASKPALVGIAQSQLPERRAAARAAALDTQDTLKANAATAKVQTDVAIAKLNDLKAQPTASAESLASAEGAVLTAKLAQNSAYRKAGLAVPWPDLSF